MLIFIEAMAPCFRRQPRIRFALCVECSAQIGKKNYNTAISKTQSGKD